MELRVVRLRHRRPAENRDHQRHHAKILRHAPQPHPDLRRPRNLQGRQRHHERRREHFERDDTQGRFLLARHDHTLDVDGRETLQARRRRKLAAQNERCNRDSRRHPRPAQPRREGTAHQKPGKTLGLQVDSSLHRRRTGRASRGRRDTGRPQHRLQRLETPDGTHL